MNAALPFLLFFWRAVAAAAAAAAAVSEKIRERESFLSCVSWGLPPSPALPTLFS